MIEAPGLETLLAVVDVVIIAMAVSLFIYARDAGLLSGRLRSTYSGLMILTGMLIVFVVHAAHVWVQLTAVGDDHEAALNPLVAFLTSDATFSTSWRIGFLMTGAGMLIAAMARRRDVDRYLDTRRELEASKYFEYQAEERFRYLFDSTSNSVYCYRFDPPVPIDLPLEEQIKRSYGAILQDCNVIFARELGAADPTEVIGGRLADLDSAKDTAAHEAWFRSFIESGYSLDGYDLNYRSPAGQDRALHIKMVGIVRDGLLHRMWAVENNVLDMRQTKAALRHRRQYQALVTDISARLVKAGDEEADSIVTDCMKDICGFIGADRSTIFLLDDTADIAEVAYIWSVDGSTIVPVSTDQFPMFKEKLLAGENVRIDDVDALPGEYSVDRNSLSKFDLKSVLVLPMIIGNQPVGAITLGRIATQADWDDQDIADMTVFAELFANFVLRVRSRQELNRALVELQQARDRLEAENVYLREEIELTHGFDEIIGRSDAVLRSLRLVEQVAPTRTPVLIMGETGTGKELIARAIHQLSDRCDRPLVKVNCAALPANLIESELFGHEKGAFTGADRARRGRFDLANGSTLFLDEIGEIPIELQAKLLRVLQEGEFEPVGSAKLVKVDVRVLAATNRDLAKAVQHGEFRSDLYYRVNTFPIEMPALRDRGDDIQLLTEHFVKVHSQRLGRDVTEISADTMRQLRDYHWPGNVRELEGIVQRALISSSGPVLNLAEPLVNGTAEKAGTSSASGTADLRFIEREHIVAVLEDANWKISGAAGAAAKLGIPPSTLRSKMKKLSIVRPS